MILRFNIPVAPTTKKTSNRTVEIGARCGKCRRGERTIVLPAERFEDFEVAVAPALQRAYATLELDRVTCSRCEGQGRAKGKRCIGCGAAGVRALPIASPVLVYAAFYRESNIGDLVGYQQAMGDVLETAGVIANDKLIALWPMPRDGGLPLRKDPARPRVEVEIEVLPVAQAELPIARAPRAVAVVPEIT